MFIKALRWLSAGQCIVFNGVNELKAGLECKNWTFPALAHLSSEVALNVNPVVKTRLCFFFLYMDNYLTTES